MPNGTCRFIVFDFDNHEKGAEVTDFANTDNEWHKEVDALRKMCELNGIRPLVERSRSGKGAHVWIFFKKAIPAATARNFGFLLLDNVWDNLMRIRNSQVATELLEIALGCSEERRKCE